MWNCLNSIIKPWTNMIFIKYNILLMFRTIKVRSYYFHLQFTLYLSHVSVFVSCHTALFCQDNLKQLCKFFTQNLVVLLGLSYEIILKRVFVLILLSQLFIYNIVIHLKNIEKSSFKRSSIITVTFMSQYKFNCSSLFVP